MTDNPSVGASGNSFRPFSNFLDNRKINTFMGTLSLGVVVGLGEFEVSHI